MDASGTKQFYRDVFFLSKQILTSAKIIQSRIEMKIYNEMQRTWKNQDNAEKDQS